MTNNTKKLKNKLGLMILTATLSLSLVACSTPTSSNNNNTTVTQTSSNSTSNKDYFSTKDLAGTYDESSATKIDLSNNNISGDGAVIESNTVKITSEGTYILSGQGNNIQVVVEASDTAKVQIVLDNVTISNTDSAIYVKQADKVFLTLKEGSSNTIKDSSSNSTENGSAAIYSKADLTINGKGTLNVEGNYGNAIKSNDDLKIAYVTLNINAKKHALSANDALNITNATLTLTSTEDAIHSDNTDNTELGNIYLKDNSITINAGDDGIHASNKVLIDGGEIKINQSNEGIEGKVITIESGEINVTAKDDAINAADGTTTTAARPGMATSGVELVINGGKITVNAGGDGLDSNGNITINGGEVYVNGPTDNGNAALDYDGAATINGGTIVIVGSSGMAQGFGNSSKQASIMTNIQGAANSKIVVKDSTGKEIINYTATKSFSNVLISSPDIKEGESYTISINGSETTVTASLTTQMQGGGMMGNPGNPGNPPRR